MLCLESGDIGSPGPEPLPHDDRGTPFLLVGDGAFTLLSYQTMAIEERTFIARLSRTRRFVENAFWKLVHRWCCLLTILQQDYETVMVIVSACLCLQIMVRLRYTGL